MIGIRMCGALLASLALGLVLGHRADTPASGARAWAELDEQILQIAHQRLTGARRRFQLDPSWEAGSELHQRLCFLHEVELGLATGHGDRPARPEEVVPSAEQVAVL